MMPPPPPPPPRRNVNENTRRPPPPPPPRRSVAPKPPQPAYPSAPPAPAPTMQNYEPYGEVPPASTSSFTTAHRRSTFSAPPNATAFPYSNAKAPSAYETPSSYAPPKPAPKVQSQAPKTFYYQSNGAALCFLVPTLMSILWWHDSPIILQTLLILGLILYGLDLMNARDAVAVVSWISALAVTMVSGFATLLQVDDSEASGGAMIMYLLRLGAEGLFFCTMACWLNLQFSWLHNDVPSVAISMERTLHALLPPLSASIFAYHLARFLMGYWGMDRVATALPYLFAVFLTVGMSNLGSLPSSFFLKEENFTHNSISSRAARCHSLLLLLVPGTVHLLSFRQRIFSRNASFDELDDLVLVWAVPYLIHCGLLYSQSSTKTPYEIPKLFPDMRERTLRGAIVPMLASVAASVAAQQRYVIPLCNKISYQFNGHNIPSQWIVSAYLNMATCAMLFAMWTGGRKSSVTGEILFGEYHEDVVQLSVSASGLFVGRAFGFPWNLTPLPTLAFFGLSVWATTRMLRYLGIFLFILQSGSVVLFSYRYASIDIRIPLPFFGAEISLARLGSLEVMTAVAILLVAGFAVRPAGGVGAEIMKCFDVTGILLIVYQLALGVLEITLLKRSNTDDISGNKVHQDAAAVYDHASAILTSISVLAISIFCQRLRIISSKASVVSISFAVAKALAVVIDASEVDGKFRDEAKQEKIAERMLYRTLAATLLLIVMIAPRVILEPIHLKTSVRHKRSLADGKPVSPIPASATRNIVIYTMVIMPASLLSSVPMVLTPFVMALSSHYGGGAYYKVAPPLSEMLGFALALWGIASLSMLNYYLPDGGAEIWKKTSALTLVMGIGVGFAAPTMPDWIIGDNGVGVSNPYASVSSLGSALVSQDRNRTGGWGILSASLATLLAVTGPLELKERRHPSGKKDKFLLFRLMVFSIMFGSGVAWFITIQSMGQEGFLELMLTALASMVVSFFGTVTCVLGYFLELENFDEVDQMTKIWIGAFAVFGVVTGAPITFVSSSMHAFGAGGWLATYLAVSSIAAFSLTMALKFRPTKNQATRGLGNASCVASYILAVLVLFGRYGVSGMDENFAVTTICGVPASIFGTFLVSPILLALEGESGTDRRSRLSRISNGSSRPPSATISLTLTKLSDSNRFAPAVAAAYTVFFFAALYAIFLRGSYFFGTSVATSHSDLFSKIKNTDKLARLAQESISHSLSLKISARMAGSGFWTASNPLGPLIHLVGLVATVPSMFSLLSHMWSGSNVAKAQIVAALPVNLIPLLFCRGIPAIPAAALLGTAGGVFQMIDMYRRDRRSQMQI